MRLPAALVIEDIDPKNAEARPATNLQQPHV